MNGVLRYHPSQTSLDEVSELSISESTAYGYDAATGELTSVTAPGKDFSSPRSRTEYLYHSSGGTPIAPGDEENDGFLEFVNRGPVFCSFCLLGKEGPLSAFKESQQLTWKHGVLESRGFRRTDGTHPGWLLENRTIDDYGRVTAEFDRFGNSTAIGYDSSGRVTSLTPVYGLPEASVEITYPSPIHTRTRRLAPNGTELDVSDGYTDQLGRPIVSVSRLPNGTDRFTVTSWDLAGYPFHVGYPALADGRLYDTLQVKAATSGTVAGTDPPGQTVVSRDALGRPLEIRDADGSSVTFGYTGALRDSVTLHGINAAAGAPGADPNGIATATSSTRRDALGRIKESTDPLGVVTQYLYNFRLESVTRGTLTRTYSYWDNGWLKSERTPEGSTTQYLDYDDRGHLIGSRDALGTKLCRRWDVFGRMTILGTDTSGALDDCSTPISLLAAYSYDDTAAFAGLVKRSRFHNLPAPGSPSSDVVDVVVEAAYDPTRGRSMLTGRTMTFEGSTELSPVAGNQLVWNYSRSFETDVETVRIGYPKWTIGASVIGPDRESVFRASRGGLSAIQANPPGTMPEASFRQFAASGASIQSILGTGTSGGSGVASLGYDEDPRGIPRPLRFTANRNATGRVWEYGPYGYDGAGNVRSIGQDGYRYDLGSRLTSATMPSILTGQTFSYDAQDNLTSRTDSRLDANGSTVASATTTYGIDSTTNRLQSMTTAGTVVATFGSDADGNMTTHAADDLSFDQLGRLRQIAQHDGDNRTVRFLYDASGEMVPRQIGNRLPRGSREEFGVDLGGIRRSLQPRNGRSPFGSRRPRPTVRASLERLCSRI